MGLFSSYCGFVFILLWVHFFIPTETQTRNKSNPTGSALNIKLRLRIEVILKCFFKAKVICFMFYVLCLYFSAHNTVTKPTTQMGDVLRNNYNKDVEMTRKAMNGWGGFCTSSCAQRASYITASNITKNHIPFLYATRIKSIPKSSISTNFFSSHNIFFIIYAK